MTAGREQREVTGSYRWRKAVGIHTLVLPACIVGPQQQRVSIDRAGHKARFEKIRVVEPGKFPAVRKLYLPRCGR